MDAIFIDKTTLASGVWSNVLQVINTNQNTHFFIMPAAQTDSCSSGSDALVQALVVAIQQSPPNQYHDPAIFCRLLCVSRKLQVALEAAAVGCLSVDLVLSASGSPERFISEPEYPGRISKQQLDWVAKRLQQGHIRQLRLSGVSACSMPQFLQVGLQLIAAMPALEQLWSDIRSCYHDCFPSSYPGRRLPEALAVFYSSFGIVIDIQLVNRSTPQAQSNCWLSCEDAQRQLSYTITQLTLGIEEHGVPGGWSAPVGAKERWQAALQQLRQMSDLRELYLPVFNPPEGALTPALSQLTSLTKLFIRHPPPPEQKALPVSLQHLTVARQFEYEHAGWPPARLPPLQLAHLTALDTLVVNEKHWAGSNFVTDMVDSSSLMCEGVPAGSSLPVSLQHLVVKGIRHVQPLLSAAQLKTLTITQGKYAISHGIYADSWMMDPGLLALTQLASLTRVELQNPKYHKFEDSKTQAARLPAALDALPVVLSGSDPVSEDSLSMGIGSGQCVQPMVQDAPSGRASLCILSPCTAAAWRTAFSSCMFRCAGRGSRCTLWTGVQVLLDTLLDRKSLVEKLVG